MHSFPAFCAGRRNFCHGAYSGAARLQLVQTQDLLASLLGSFSVQNGVSLSPFPKYSGCASLDVTIRAPQSIIGYLDLPVGFEMNMNNNNPTVISDMALIDNQFYFPSCYINSKAQFWYIGYDKCDIWYKTKMIRLYIEYLV